jgi:hypothetical protein
MINKIIKSLNYRVLKNFYLIKSLSRNFYRVRKLDYKKPIFLNCDNLRENLTRAQSCSKEPETIKWLEKYKNKTVSLLRSFFIIWQFKKVFLLLVLLSSFSILYIKSGFRVSFFEIYSLRNLHSSNIKIIQKLLLKF